MRADKFEIVPWLIYPAVMASGIAVYFHLAQLGTPLLWASYLPVLGAALLITTLEWTFPHRRAWHPSANDIKTDASFMLAIQIALPYLVSSAFVLWFLESGNPETAPLHALWPHRWPIAAQTALMIFSADFLRYWLHRAAHENAVLWRLHAVHHSPQRLYWLNVGRFHPLDKALQMSLDTLPFILVGVDAHVASLYFVFYAINGFFQHCNVRLRFGPLNYLISSAELHRWHHSRIPGESNRNYGNNIIVWDWLFGTRFLPADRDIGDLGLKNRSYPSSMSDQFRAPFTPELTNRPVPVLTWREILRRPLLALSMRRHYRQLMRRVVPAARDPVAAQERTLRRILATQVGTRFGVAHHFSEIRSPREFRERVPIQNFESLRPWIDEQMRGIPALTTETPVMYARTSGTTATPKLLPVVHSSLAQYRAEQHAMCAIQYSLCPEAFHGKALGMVGPAVEGHAPDGKSYGSVSGYFYATMPPWMRSRYAVPAEVFSIEDYELKYQLILRFALAEEHITYLAAANPSSFLKLLEVLNAHTPALLDSLATGVWTTPLTRDHAVTKQIGRRLAAQPARAQLLRELRHQRPLTFADVWPSIRMLTTWSGGSCGIALDNLRTKLPSHTVVYDLGYVASELRGTLSLDGGPFGLPLLDQHFFEFAERDAWESGVAAFLTLDQLQPNTQYYVFVTTAAGLYRYAMDDVVEVGGTFERTPLLRFVQKGSGVTNITGEKIYESQLIEAVRRAERTFGFHSVYYTLVADEAACSYALYLEHGEAARCDASQLAKFIDQSLAEINIEYGGKRASGRLQPLMVLELEPGTGELIKQDALKRAKRESQYKPKLLHHRRELDFPLDRHVLLSAEAAPR